MSHNKAYEKKSKSIEKERHIIKKREKLDRAMCAAKREILAEANWHKYTWLINTASRVHSLFLFVHPLPLHFISFLLSSYSLHNWNFLLWVRTFCTFYCCCRCCSRSVKWVSGLVVPIKCAKKLHTSLIGVCACKHVRYCTKMNACSRRLTCKQRTRCVLTIKHINYDRSRM